MTVKTKFNVGDTLYTIHNNKVEKITVKEINIEINKKHINVLYKSVEEFLPFPSMSGFCGDQFTIDRPEEELFSTKEELLKSL